MNAPSNNAAWSLRDFGRSKHSGFRDKQRRRERLRSKLAAKQRFTAPIEF